MSGPLLMLSVGLRFTAKFAGAVFFILVPFVASSLAVDNAQTLIPVFLIGSAASQFCVGALSETFGTRRILLTQLACLVAGTILCGAAFNFASMLVGVAVQSIGVGAMGGIGNTLIFDRCHNQAKATRALSFTSVIVIWAPALAMNLGLVIARADWRYFFYLQACWGFALWGTSFITVPTNSVSSEPARRRLVAAVNSYGTLLVKFEYTRIAARMCLAGGGIVVFYTSALPYLQAWAGPSHIGVGVVPILVVAANSVGRIVAGTLATKVSAERLGRIGSTTCLLATVTMTGFALLQTNPLWTFLPFIVYVVGVGVMFSSQRTELMVASAGRPVTSESLIGILTSVSGSVFAVLSPFVTSISPDVPTGISLLLLSMTIVSCLRSNWLNWLKAMTIRLRPQKTLRPRPTTVDRAVQTVSPGRL
ncbi:MAG: MFS transporter [Pirellulaceae bacterium]